VTLAGKAASEMAKAYFAEGGGLASVDLEFDTDDPVEVCLVEHRDNFGRLLCYVHKGEENYNLKLAREGWSPYFVKYGRSRLYDGAFMAAEAEAQAHNRVVWDPDFNGAGALREYDTLLPWWWFRAAIVEDYRRVAGSAEVLSVRLDYQRLLEAMNSGATVSVLCDLQGGVNRWTEDGAVVFAGSVQHKFNLWIPDARDEEKAPLIRLIERRYAGQGRGYVYVSGKVSEFMGNPQIVLTDTEQLADSPPEPRDG
jgi:micrococcal nuclease